MKSRTILGLFIMVISSSIFAQNYNYNNALTLQTGPITSGRWASEKINALTPEEADKLVTSTKYPSFMINWDLAPGEKRRFSLNTGLGFHWTTVTYDSDGSIPGRGVEKRVDNGSSWTWGTRALLHFLNKEGSKLDIYTGFGVYVTLWTFEREGNPNFIYANSPFVQGGAPLFLGGRYYFANQWAATAEISTYSNFPLSIGITRAFSAFD